MMRGEKAGDDSTKQSHGVRNLYCKGLSAGHGLQRHWESRAGRKVSQLSKTSPLGNPHYPSGWFEMLHHLHPDRERAADVPHTGWLNYPPNRIIKSVLCSLEAAAE